MNTVFCPSCRRDVVPVRPSFLWKLAIPAGAVFTAMLVGLIAMLGIGLLIFAPVVALFGLAIFGNLVEGATRLPYCSNPACGKYLTGNLVAQSASLGRREEATSRPVQNAA